MSIPKEPRQQMINIMYLVLTALLALNVSAEILKAFDLIRKGIDRSNVSITGKVGSTMEAFAAKVKKENRGQNFYDAAGKSRTISAEFQSFIDSLDQMLVDEIGLDTTTGSLKKPDDQDTPTRLFVEKDKLGYALEEKVNATRTALLSLVSGDDRKAVEPSISLSIDSIPPNSNKKDWPTFTFYQMPAAGVRTLLSKFKSDAVSSEAAMVDYLFSKVGEETILFNRFKAAVVPSATTLVTGEKFEAEIFLAASSSMSRPSIVAGGRALQLDENGVAKYSTVVSAPGEYSVTGTVTSKDSYGKTNSYPFTQKYKVMSPPDHAAIVSATKMNVFYIGVDNPVKATITGMRQDEINVSMTGGTINKGGESGYTVRVTSPGKASVNVSGKKRDGSAYSGSAEFRVKRIPDPVPEVGGKSGGAMGTGEFKAQGGVAAVLKDFDFDARFEVLGFELTLSERGQDLQTAVNPGPRYSGQAANLVARAKVGSIYYFDNIRAKGPDGTTRQLPTISFKIK
jgi:gliding motility-associated protein GldM